MLLSIYRFPRQRSTGCPNLVTKFFALDGNGQTRSRRKSVPFVVGWLLFHFRIDDSPWLFFLLLFAGQILLRIILRSFTTSWPLATFTPPKVDLLDGSYFNSDDPIIECQQ